MAHILSHLPLRSATFLAISLLSLGTVAQAETAPATVQKLHAMDCQWWGYVAAFTYDDYAYLASENVQDPMRMLKVQLDYDGYHAYSAGRAMLDEVFAKIDAGAPVWMAQDTVTEMCHSFPADAVNPENVFDPLLGETL